VLVFGERLALGQAYVAASWRENDQRALSSRVTLLGFELDSQEIKVDDALALRIRSDSDFDEKGDVSFSIGPFTVPVRYGVTGVSDFLLAATTDGLDIRAEIQPNIEAYAYAQLGANLHFVEMALRGTVLVLRDEVDVLAQARLVENRNDLLLFINASFDNRFRALDGYLTGYAKSGVFGKREIEQDFFSWKGYEFDDLILAIDDVIKL